MTPSKRLDHAAIDPYVLSTVLNCDVYKVFKL